MTFLQKSGLKKHLSTKLGHLLQAAESSPTEGARVVLRDGNLISLPPSADKAVKTQEIDQT